MNKINNLLKIIFITTVFGFTGLYIWYKGGNMQQDTCSQGPENRRNPKQFPPNPATILSQPHHEESMP